VRNKSVQGRFRHGAGDGVSSNELYGTTPNVTAFSHLQDLPLKVYQRARKDFIKEKQIVFKSELS